MLGQSLVHGSKAVLDRYLAGEKGFDLGGLGALTTYLVTLEKFDLITRAVFLIVILMNINGLEHLWRDSFSYFLRFLDLALHARVLEQVSFGFLH